MKNGQIQDGGKNGSVLPLDKVKMNIA